MRRIRSRLRFVSTYQPSTSARIDVSRQARQASDKPYQFLALATGGLLASDLPVLASQATKR